jgi:hypothetical protein
MQAALDMLPMPKEGGKEVNKSGDDFPHDVDLFKRDFQRDYSFALENANALALELGKAFEKVMVGDWGNMPGWVAAQNSIMVMTAIALQVVDPERRTQKKMIKDIRKNLIHGIDQGIESYLRNINEKT